ncbi:MAG TPA: DinB family protein [Fimbriimonadales bacterium]|nr:DinB family protein [Fimbriimonadales bacterium]
MNVESLLHYQERSFAKSPWHSLMGALKGISEEVFFWVPPKHHGFPWMDGSIRDIVYHVTGDKLVQISTAFEGGIVTWDTLKSELEKENMETMMKQLQEANNKVVNKLRDLSDEELPLKVSTWGGKRMTIMEFFLMLIEHDIYHAGQIRYIRNIAE